MRTRTRRGDGGRHASDAATGRQGRRSSIRLRLVLLILLVTVPVSLSGW